MKAFAINVLLMFLVLDICATGEINVKNYGAKADGKTDDTQAIQMAINSASPFSKNTIYFPAGTYLINSYTITPVYFINYCLLLHSNLYLKGAGDKTIIRIADNLFDKIDSNANAHLFFGKNISNINFSDLLIDMNGANNLVPSTLVKKNNAAIFAYYGSNYYIHNITIKNCSGTNMINIMSKGSGLRIEDCHFLNGGNFVGASIPNKNQYDYSFLYSEWDSTIIKNNIIQQRNIDISLSNYTGGIELHGNFSIASGNVIIGCWPAIFITSSNNGGLQNVKIENNKMINCVTGISFWLVYSMKNISIDNNEITLTHSRSSKLSLCAGISMPNGNAKDYNSKLANAAPLENLEIKNNSISADSMKDLSAGMILHSLQKGNIKNNIIKGMNYGGVVLQGSKWGIDSLLVEKNKFTDFRKNNHPTAVAGYIIITDTYSPGIMDAPGFKNVLFSKNQFVRSTNNAQLDINQNDKLNKARGGNFYGVFLALPQKMIEGIKFKNNKFTSSSEGIKVIKTER